MQACQDTQLLDKAILYVYHNYPEMKSSLTIQQLTEFMNSHQDNIVFVDDGELIKGVAWYLKLTDETFKKIVNINLKDSNTMNDLLKENGNNIHFVLLVADGSRTIRKGLKIIKDRERPRSISGFNQDMTQLFIRRN